MKSTQSSSSARRMSVLQQHLFPSSLNSSNGEHQFGSSLKEETLLNESFVGFNETSSVSDSQKKRKAVIVCGARTPFVKAFGDLMEVG